MLLIMLVVTSAVPAFAGDTLFTSTTALQNEGKALLDEAVDVCAAPFRLENGALYKTLAVAGAFGAAYAFDTTIRDKVQGIQSKGLDDAAKIGSNIIGNPFVHLGVAVAVYGGGVLGESERWKDTGLMLGEAAILADVSTLILKQAIGRGRPSVNKGKSDYKPFQFASDYDSLPSMHTSSSFAMASVISSTSESLPVKLLSYTAAAFVGFARIYQDKHWTSDVILGAALGELCGRVVTAYHSNKMRFALVPMASQEMVGIALLKQW